MTKSIYNFRNIRTLLTEGFSKEELRTLCIDEESFRPARIKIPWDAGQAKIILKLLDYAERRKLTDDLLRWAKKENPNRYHFHQPYDLTRIKDILESEYLTRESLGKFFNLEGHNREITIYLSRHSATIQLPKLEGEVELDDENNSAKDGFDVIAAVEMLEAIWLKDAIERPIHWLPDQMQEELKKVEITVKIEVCPELKDIEKTLSKGTMIFIGGPRANLGTLYYLFKLEAGMVRPKRWLPKDVIECINNSSNKSCRCEEENFNLGVIQRHRIIDGPTIIYLAGTGINGTGAAVAYLRKKWIKLLKKDENFYKVIQVPRRDPKEKLTNYHQNYWWTDKKWTKVKF